jgi:hypothetical protein
LAGVTSFTYRSGIALQCRIPSSPWTIAYNPNYQSEARIYAKYILKNHPDAKIGILFQNDDLGRDYVTGLKAGLGDKAATMIIGDPQWEDDAGLKTHFAFMDRYYPEGDKLNTVNIYGYATAELLVHILRQCGDDLTRENIMKQATSLKSFTGSLALPGMSAHTSPTDYRINEQMQMMKFDSERWQLFGPIIEDTGVSG